MEKQLQRILDSNSIVEEVKKLKLNYERIKTDFENEQLQNKIQNKQNNKTIKAKEEEIEQLQKEINKYEALLATADETDKNKYEKILNVLRTDLSLLDHAGRSKEEIIKDDEVLAIDNLCMYFGGIKAVNKLSFTVKHKEIFGLIGPNGHSKNATNGQYLTYVPLVAFFVRERNRPPITRNYLSKA